MTTLSAVVKSSRWLMHKMVPKKKFLTFVCVCGFAGVFYYTLHQIARYSLPRKTYSLINDATSLTGHGIISVSQQQSRTGQTDDRNSISMKTSQMPPDLITKYTNNSMENLETFTINRPSKEKLRKFRSDVSFDEKFLRNDERSIERIVEGIEGQTGPLTPSIAVFRKSGELQKRFPVVIIIGVKKGGTRALLEMLKLHPRVCACGPEMHFFDRYYSKGLPWYRDKMPLCYDNELTVEKTPSYFVTNGVAKDMYSYSKMLNSTLKLLVILRDPTTRAISDYTQNIRKSPEKRPPRKVYSTFEDLALRETKNGSLEVNQRWGAIKIGVYSKHLKRWWKYFTPEQLYVVSAESLIKKPYDEIQKVERFLNLPPFIKSQHFVYNATKGFYCFDRSLSTFNNEVSSTPSTSSLRCLGTSKGRSHAKISERTEKILRDFYRPFNEELYSMVKRNFGWL